MKKQELIPLVIDEATKLRKLATEQEKEKLNFKTLDPKRRECCIYGQMTGDCVSNRAHKLINQCAKKVIDVSGDDVDIDKIAKAKINGKPNFKTRGVYVSFFDGFSKERRGAYYSPIEVFIVNTNKANNKKLIDFIKGKTDKLELK